jgi:four helix bundle protein
MPKITRFEDLKIWQSARKLASEVYRFTKEPPFCNDFALRDQVRKSAISILSNIAEGFERDGSREFVQFLSLSKASNGELRS